MHRQQLLAGVAHPAMAYANQVARWYSNRSVTLTYGGSLWTRLGDGVYRSTVAVSKAEAPPWGNPALVAPYTDIFAANGLTYRVLG